MSSFDLFSEAVARTTAAQDGWLIGQGVDPEWLYGGASRYGALRVAANDNDGWDAAETGGQAMIVLPELPLPDPWDVQVFDIGDLIACNPRNPSEMWARNGCRMINPEAPEYARHFEVDLRIYADPIAYLVGKQVGCVIVDWSEMTSFPVIGPRKIICDTLEIGERVDRLFRSSRVPEIHITQEKLGAA